MINGRFKLSSLSTLLGHLCAKLSGTLQRSLKVSWVWKFVCNNHSMMSKLLNSTAPAPASFIPVFLLCGRVSACQMQPQLEWCGTWSWRGLLAVYTKMLQIVFRWGRGAGWRGNMRQWWCEALLCRSINL